MEKFINKKIAVLGFGIEGVDVLRFLPENSDITVFDRKDKDNFDPEILNDFIKKGIKFEFGEIKSLDNYDIVVRSPGINPSSEIINQAKNKGAEITSATKIFFDLCPAQIIGVTGTKGKGTTSTLIFEMLKKEGFDAYLGGNIGNSPLVFLRNLNSESKVVLELSSFQLIDLDKSPHVAVMLMVTSEHLDYHKDVYEYVEAKRNILRYQNKNDIAILNKDYPATRESDILTEGIVYMVSRDQEVENGCYVRDGKLVLKHDGREMDVIDVGELGLKGKHNWDNASAAIVAAYCLGVNLKSIVSVLKSFKGLEHRIEFVTTVKGVSYYDDSFSTTPETAIAAIDSFDEPKILILGGSSKRSDFTELGQVISQSNSIKAIIGIGAEWEQIKAKLKTQSSKFKVYEGCKNMKEVVQKANEIGEIGDIVLLSPACASFDMFKSYKDRGEQFKKEVFALHN